MNAKNKYFILILLALVWGTSFILIKKSVDVFSPYQVGALRVSMAGLVLMIFGIPALKRLDRKTIMWAGLAGFFGNFIPMYLFPMAEVRVSSSLAGILNSLVPIFTLLFAYLLFQVKSSKVQILGAVIGFFGANILMIFGGGSHEDSSFWYAMLVVLATMSYALSGLIVKEKLNHVKSMDLGGIVFSIWFFPSIVILFFSGFFQQWTGSDLQWEGLMYVSILALIGTAMAMILFYKLIQQTSAVFASTVTYLMPLVAILWGVVAGEELNVWFIVGGALILGGIYLIREKPNLDKIDIDL